MLAMAKIKFCQVYNISLKGYVQLYRPVQIMINNKNPICFTFEFKWVLFCTKRQLR